MSTGRVPRRVAASVLGLLAAGWLLGASAAPARAQVTGPTVQFSQANYTIGESDGFATIDLTWSGSPDPTAEVRLVAGSTGDTATPAADYSIAVNPQTNLPDNLRFFSQDTPFFVVVSQDKLLEKAETVTLTLQPVQGISIGAQATATLTIEDDGRLTAPSPVSFTWKAKDKNNATLTLKWKNNASNVTNFEVFRANGHRHVTEADLFRTVGGGATSIVDNSVAPGGKYTYAVRAINETLDVSSAFSPEAQVSIGKPSGDGKPGPITRFGLRLSRNSLKFGDVHVGRGKNLSLTIRNTLGTPARVTVGGLDAPFALVGGDTEFTLAGGQSRTLRVNFRPTARRTFHDSLAIGLPDAENQPQVLLPTNGKGVR